jgi:hypothetical protein
MALPLFVTGEPKKQWNFSWVLSPPSPATIREVLRAFSKNSGATALQALEGLLDFLRDTATSYYISQLAKSIDLPENITDTEPITLATLEFPILKSFPIKPIQVEYMEDQINSVYLYHRKWQELARNSLNFCPLTSCCQQGIYIPTAVLPLAALLTPGLASGKLSSDAWGKAINSVNRNPLNNQPLVPLASELPVGLEIYPQIFPISIKRNSVDKTAKVLSTTTITYTRVPNITYRKTGILGMIKGF